MLETSPPRSDRAILVLYLGWRNAGRDTRRREGAGHYLHPTRCGAVKGVDIESLATRGGERDDDRNSDKNVGATL